MLIRKQKIYQIELGLISLTLLLNYFKTNNWSLILITYLISDLAGIGFFISTRIGELAYNCTHSLIGLSLLTLY